VIGFLAFARVERDTLSNESYAESADKGRRPPFFAVKFIRIASSECDIAADYGAEAMLLLSIVAIREDAARYTGPVSISEYNLARLTGCRNESQLKRVRKLLIDTGWLGWVYGENKRTRASYFVKVPPAFHSLFSGVQNWQMLNPYDSSQTLEPEEDTTTTSKKRSSGRTSERTSGRSSARTSERSSGRSSGRTHVLPIPEPEPNPNPVCVCNPADSADPAWTVLSPNL
jgi:hypothetical protein